MKNRLLTIASLLVLAQSLTACIIEPGYQGRHSEDGHPGVIHERDEVIADRPDNDRPGNWCNRRDCR